MPAGSSRPTEAFRRPGHWQPMRVLIAAMPPTEPTPKARRSRAPWPDRGSWWRRRASAGAARQAVRHADQHRGGRRGARGGRGPRAGGLAVGGRGRARGVDVDVARRARGRAGGGFRAPQRAQQARAQRDQHQRDAELEREPSAGGSAPAGRSARRPRRAGPRVAGAQSTPASDERHRRSRGSRWSRRRPDGRRRARAGAQGEAEAEQCQGGGSTARARGTWKGKRAQGRRHVPGSRRAAMRRGAALARSVPHLQGLPEGGQRRG